MTRQFLNDQPASASVPASAGAPSGVPAAPVRDARPVLQDALAGAFPAWDLLPATPFIRRVK